MGVTVTKTLGLTATPDPKSLDMDLATRLCHESVITK